MGALYKGLIATGILSLIALYPVLSYIFGSMSVDLGGFTPMIVIYTIKRSHYDLSPAFLMMAAAAVSFAFILGTRETYKLALSSPGARPRTEAA